MPAVRQSGGRHRTPAERPYERPQPRRDDGPGSWTGGSRAGAAGSSSSQTPGLLGRIAGGVLKFISPWKPRVDPEDDNVPAEDEDDEEVMAGTDDNGYGHHQGASWGPPEPELQAYARRLPNSVDRLHVGQDQHDESTEISTADTSHERHQLHLSSAFAREGDGHSMTDPGSGVFGAEYRRNAFRNGVSGNVGVPSPLRGTAVSSGERTAGGGFISETAGWSGAENMEGELGRGLMIRPRGVRKDLMNALKVAQTVSRMGKENIKHKRALKLKFDAQDLKAYMPSNETAEQGGEPSAFRIAVARPRATALALPTRVIPQRVPPPRRGYQHTSYASAYGDESALGMSVLSSSHNASTSMLESSSMVAFANSTVADSTLGGSYSYGDSSVLSDSGAHAQTSSYSAAKQALASLSAVLSPLGDRAGGSGRQVHGGASRMGGRDQYSVPPPVFSSDMSDAAGHKIVQSGMSFSRERIGSEKEDVGSKRTRESFAPEPSPLLASDRRNASSDIRARPAQRRRISQPSNTVKKIMDIIKDTSTSHSDARTTPSSRYFNSSSVYATRQTNMTAYDDEGEQQSSFSSASPLGAGGKRPVGQGSGKYSFKEPEASEYSVKTGTGAGMGIVNGSMSRSTYVFSEPSDRIDMDHNNDTADSAPAAASKADRASTGSAMVEAGDNGSSALPSLSEMFKLKPGEWDCPKCMTRNKPEAKIKCLSCEEAKPGAPSAAGSGGAPAAASFNFGTKAAATAKNVAPPAGSSSQPSLAELFKIKPGEWDCEKCMTRNKAEAKTKCMSCEEPKPGAAPDTGGSTAAAGSFTFGVKAPAAASSTTAASGGFTFGTSTTPAGTGGSTGGGGASGGFKFGSSSLAPAASAPTGFTFGSKSTEASSSIGASGTMAFGTKPLSSPSQDSAVSTGFGSKAKPASDVQAAKPELPAPTPSGSADNNSQDIDASKNMPPGAAKVVEAKKAEAAKKGWVTSGFQWPDKKVDVAFESTGNKELDADDSAEGRVATGVAADVAAKAATASTAAPAATPSFGSTPAATAIMGTSAFSFGSAAPTGSTSIGASFTFAKAGDSSSFNSGSSTGFSFGASAPKTEAAPAPVSGVGFAFGATTTAASSTAASAGVSSAAASFSFGSASSSFGTSTGSSSSSGAATSSSAAPAFGGGSTGTSFSFGGASATSSSTGTASSSAVAPGASAAPLSFGFTSAASASTTGVETAINTAAAAAPSSGFASTSFSSSAFGASASSEPKAASTTNFGATATPAVTPASSTFSAATNPAASASSTATSFAFGAGASGSSSGTTSAFGAGAGFGAGASSGASFAFGASSSTGAAAFGSTNTGATSSSSVFAFGANSAAAAPSVFSAGASSSAFGATPSTGTAFSFGVGTAAPAAVPAFSFGAAGNSAAPSTGAFTFGATSTPASVPQAASAALESADGMMEGDDTPSAPAQGGFGGGTTFGSGVSAAASGSAFAFGAPSSTPAFGGGGSSTGASFAFGGASSSAAPAFGGFSGAPVAGAVAAATPAFGGFSGAAAPAAAPGGFAFGAPVFGSTTAAPAQSAGFAFGASSGSAFGGSAAPAFSGFGGGGGGGGGFGVGGGGESGGGDSTGGVPARKMIKARRSLSQKKK